MRWILISIQEKYDIPVPSDFDYSENPQIFTYQKKIPNIFESCNFERLIKLFGPLVRGREIILKSLATQPVVTLHNIRQYDICFFFLEFYK
jgi:hypothetical protein